MSSHPDLAEHEKYPGLYGLQTDLGRTFLSAWSPQATQRLEALYNHGFEFEGGLECPTCDWTGYNEADRISHMASHKEAATWDQHGQVADYFTKRKPGSAPHKKKTSAQVCPSCGNAHMEEDAKEGQRCPSCGNTHTKPQAVARRNPLQRIRQVVAERNPKMAICPYCFGPETLVRIRDGFAPIASLVPGDEVLSGDGLFHRVHQVMERDFDGMALSFRADSMIEPVIVTPEHPFLVLRATHKKTTKRWRKSGCSKAFCEHDFPDGTHHLEWIEAKDLTDLDWVVMNTSREGSLSGADISSITIPSVHGGSWRNGSMEMPLTDDVLWALGMYLAEGSVGKRTVQFGLHEKEIEFLHRLRTTFSRLGYNSAVHHTSAHGVQLEVYSSTLASWFTTWLGSGCENKAIPVELLGLSRRRKGLVIQGVLDGDGYNEGNSLGQTSPQLALQIAEWAWSDNESVPYVKPEYSSTKKTAYRMNHLIHPSVRQWELEGRPLVRVKEIRPVPYAGKVYNLQVEGDPTYTVQNILVHNCGKKIEAKRLAHHIEEDHPHQAVPIDAEEESKKEKGHKHEGAAGNPFTPDNTDQTGLTGNSAKPMTMPAPGAAGPADDIGESPLEDMSIPTNMRDARLNQIRQDVIDKIASDIYTANPGLPESHRIHLATETVRRYYPHLVTARGGADYVEGETLSDCPQCGKRALNTEIGTCHNCGYVQKPGR
jgi:ribosomal protein L37AE/L43A